MQTMQPTTTNDGTWDFSPVFDLLHSLASQDPGSPKRENAPLRHSPHDTSSTSPAKADITEQIKGGLGNFTRLWDYLGVPKDAPTPSVPPFEASIAESAKGHDAYASDGALYYPPSSKSEWQRADLWDLTDSPDANPEEAGLTKNQRKKRNRKFRKAADAAKRHQETNRSGRSPPSDNGLEKNPIPPYTANTKSQGEHSNGKVINNASSDEEALHNVQTRAIVKPSAEEKSNKNVETHATALKTSFKDSKPSINNSESTQRALESSNKVPKATPSAIEEARNKVAAASHTPKKTTVHPTPSWAKTINESLKKPWHFQDSAAAQFQQYGVQSALHTRASQSTQISAQGGDAISFPAIHQQPCTRLRHEILPLANVSSVDRNWALLLKLLHSFPEDRKYLVSPLQLSINRPQPDGIHVFVDASNILIGFYEHLKAARGILAHARVPRVDLNFHALALLLERRRPVAKRVLAGSTPEIQVFEEARQVGYETCILDKVWKAKELTDRQKRHQAKDASVTGNGYVSGSESAGNGAPKDAQKAKWVEQAVDEILHLKILESVVDTDIPADAMPASSMTTNGIININAVSASGGDRAVRPIMVLATGDAAEAEYSAGFRKMVERALRSGWMVELMAFGRSVSMDYRKMERLPLARGGWGERFQIIELDDYAEELFGEGL